MGHYIPTIIYHGNCFDGFTAAYIASNAISNRDILRGETARKQDLIPMNYGDPIPTDLVARELFILDFSFPRDIMEKLQKDNYSIKVLDHHKTAAANCEGLDFCTFDMNRSGAGLTWDYFYPELSRPNLVNYVEDRDLWRFKLPSSREIHAYISSFAMEFGIWDQLYTALEGNFGFCVHDGEAILRYHSQKVREIAKLASIQNLAGYEVPIANCPYLFASDVGHQLLQEFPESPFAGSYFYRADGQKQYSLRGRDSDSFDVSEVAKLFGGGGHKKAAGFEVKPDGGTIFTRCAPAVDTL